MKDTEKLNRELDLIEKEASKLEGDAREAVLKMLAKARARMDEFVKENIHVPGTSESISSVELEHQFVGYNFCHERAKAWLADYLDALNMAWNGILKIDRRAVVRRFDKWMKPEKKAEKKVEKRWRVTYESHGGQNTF